VKKIKGLRWYIAGLLCLATALNYLDQQTLALLAHTLEQQLGITTIRTPTSSPRFSRATRSCMPCPGG
jgi:hypothetical protein